MTDAPAPASPKSEQERLTGIGGWLILPIIMLGTTVVFTFKELTTVANDREAMAGFALAFDESAPAELRGVLFLGLASLVAAIGLIGVAAACFVQIVKLRRSVPVWMTVFFVLSIFCTGLDWFALYYTAKTVPLAALDKDLQMAAGQTIGSGLRAAIWVPYFWMSKRVKYTFVK